MDIPDEFLSDVVTNGKSLRKKKKGQNVHYPLFCCFTLRFFKLFSCMYLQFNYFHSVRNEEICLNSCSWVREIMSFCS